MASRRRVISSRPRSPVSVSSSISSRSRSWRESGSRKAPCSSNASRCDSSVRATSRARSIRSRSSCFACSCCSRSASMSSRSSGGTRKKASANAAATPGRPAQPRCKRQGRAAFSRAPLAALSAAFSIDPAKGWSGTSARTYNAVASWSFSPSRSSSSTAISCRLGQSTAAESSPSSTAPPKITG